MLWIEANEDGLVLNRAMLSLAPRRSYVMDADKLSSYIVAAFERYGLVWDTIKHLCRGLCTDNASDVTAAADRLGVPTHPCLNHIIDLALKAVKVCLRMTVWQFISWR